MYHNVEGRSPAGATSAAPYKKKGGKTKPTPREGKLNPKKERKRRRRNPARPNPARPNPAAGTGAARAHRRAGQGEGEAGVGERGRGHAEPVYAHAAGEWERGWEVAHAWEKEGERKQKGWHPGGAQRWVGARHG